MGRGSGRKIERYTGRRGIKRQQAGKQSCWFGSNGDAILAKPIDRSNLMSAQDRRWSHRLHFLLYTTQSFPFGPLLLMLTEIAVWWLRNPARKCR